MGGTFVRVTLGVTYNSLEMQMRGDSDPIQGSPAENPWMMGHVGLGGTLRGIPIATNDQPRLTKISNQLRQLIMFTQTTPR